MKVCPECKAKARWFMVFGQRGISYLSDEYGNSYGMVTLFEDGLDNTDSVKCMGCDEVMGWDDLIEVEDEQE